MVNIDKDLIQNGIRNFDEKQLIVTIEELSELTKELTKDLRGKENIDNIIEELADVVICCETVKQYFYINDEDIQKVVDTKLERLR